MKFDWGWAAIGAAVIAAFLAGAVILLLLYEAHAQEHQHPTETITGATALFYETWRRPDIPTSSCCDQKDCYATKARQHSGKLQAMHRETGEWIDVPPEKVEQNRDSPDGLNHLCASSVKFVYCFISGAGG